MHVSSSPSYWDGVNEKFYAKYHGLNECHNTWKDLVLSGKPIVGPLGRFWPIAMGRDKYGELKIPWTTLTNYPVQGTGADVMMIARISFSNRLKRTSWGTKVLLISSVHDSIVVDAPSHLLQEITNLFHQVFDDLPSNIKKLYGYEWKVPLACEVKAGPNMLNQEKLQRSDV